MVHLLLFSRYQASLHQVLVPKSSSVSKAFSSKLQLMWHVFLCSICPWAYFLELSISQLILSSTSQGSPCWFWQLLGILVQSLFGLLGDFSHRGWAKLPLPFLPSLRPKVYPFMSLGFLLLNLNRSWLTDWAFPILESQLVLDFNTHNILHLHIVLGWYRHNQFQPI